MTRELSPAELIEFRDAWVHQDSSFFAASIDELLAWDDQLFRAIQRGDVDPRSSSEIEEDEAAERMARLVAGKVMSLLAPHIAHAPANENTADTPRELAASDLLRARIVGMTSREWRAAIRRGELRACKVGREYLATRAAYEAFVAAKSVAPAPKRGGVRGKKDQAAAAIERAIAFGQLHPITPRKKR